jgi:hypothetical protein
MAVMAGEHTDVVGCTLHGPPVDVWMPELRESIEAFGVERRKGLSTGLHALLRHRLSPFGGEALGGSASLVDVGVRGGVNDSALGQQAHQRPSSFNDRVAALHASVFSDDHPAHAVTEIDILVDLMVVAIPHQPVMRDECTDRGEALKRADHPAHVPHGIRSVDLLPSLAHSSKLSAWIILAGPPRP